MRLSFGLDFTVQRALPSSYRSGIWSVRTEPENVPQRYLRWFACLADDDSLFEPSNSQHSASLSGWNRVVHFPELPLHTIESNADAKRKLLKRNTLISVQIDGVRQLPNSVQIKYRVTRRCLWRSLACVWAHAFVNDRLRRSRGGGDNQLIMKRELFTLGGCCDLEAILIDLQRQDLRLQRGSRYA
jgi:hypothetical protein